MGVRGLATFISSNSQEYLVSHRLNDCTIVVDGNNLASQLYIHASKSNPAYGGDYDRYYRCIRHFFDCLAECKVQALVLFDGGYEKRKLPTVWDRLRGKIFACNKVNPNNQTRKNVFPLLMRETFREILTEMGVSFGQCDFEADDELAALARDLRCPVLSLDSDFFVLDVMYLPFDRFQLGTTSGKDAGHSSTFICCDIYHLHRFLDSFGGLQQEMLPLMATLLGNDYIKRKLFDPFFAQIKKPRSKKLSEQQRRIAGLLEWLRKETMESAIPKVLYHIKMNDKEVIKDAIGRAIAAYNVSMSEMKKYLDLTNIRSTVLVSGKISTTIPYDELDDTNDAEVEEEPIQSQSSDEEMEEGGELSEVGDDSDCDGKIPDYVPEFFIDAYRRGRMPAVFMDLFTFQIFIMQPQKEDFSERESASAISLPLVRFMVSILLGPERAVDVRLVTRRFRSPLKESLFQEDGFQPFSDLPSLQSIPSFNQQQRQELIFKATGLKMDLTPLPEEWRLFFLAVTYWATQPDFLTTDRMVHSVVLGLVLQAVVHPVKKGKESAVQLLAKSAEQMIKHELANVNSSECKHVYGEVYAQNSFTKSTNKKGGYDTGIVHSLAQLQSVILALHQLNQLLLMPFVATPMHRIFSGTLMYNVAHSLQSRHDPGAYVKTCLAKSPSVFSLFNELVTVVLNLAPDIKKISSKKKKHRAKKIVDPEELQLENDMIESVVSDQEDDDWGENNRFALLKVN